MPKPSKKVVLLIVEGICDEHLLAGRLKKLYKGANILFEVQHGDVLCNSYGQSGNQIKSVVGGIVTKFVKKRKFRDSDVLAVFHIADTDGCFIPDENVVVDVELQKKTFYQLDKIVVSSEYQRERILDRNKERSRNIRTMITTDTIKKCTYRLYYFSSNLEHILFDEQNSDDEKFHAVDKFLNDLSVPIEEYLKVYMQDLLEGTLEEQYKHSWSCIVQEVASLQRNTNVPLLFSNLRELY